MRYNGPCLAGGAENGLKEHTPHLKPQQLLDMAIFVAYKVNCASMSEPMSVNEAIGLLSEHPIQMLQALELHKSRGSNLAGPMRRFAVYEGGGDGVGKNNPVVETALRLVREAQNAEESAS